MRGWFGVPGLSLLLFAWTGCASRPVDPTVLPLDGFGRAVAEVECAHVFGCCDATELMSMAWTDEARCRQMVAATVQMAVNEILAEGVVVYDAKAARRCIDETAAVDCLRLPSGGVGSLLGPSCGQAVRGALPQGAACEDLDFICASGNCTGTCAPPRACWDVTCDAGQYCDATLSACAPTKADGAACVSDIECRSPSVCVASVCGAPHPDGAACAENSDCASDLCSSVTATGVVCSPRFCDGV